MSVACRPESGIPSHWLPIDRAPSSGDSSRKARSCSPVGRSAGHRIPVAFAIRFPPRRITICTSLATAMGDSVSVGKHVSSTTASPPLVVIVGPEAIKCWVRTHLQQHAFHSRDNSVSNIDPNGTGRGTSVEFVVLARHRGTASTRVGMAVAPELGACTADYSKERFHETSTYKFVHRSRFRH